MFKTESGKHASSSSEAYGFWRTVNFVVKVLLCLLFFCLVLGSAVLSKLTLLVMVFSINPLQLDTVLPGLGNTTTGLVVKVRTRVILRQTMDRVICLRLDSFLLLHRFPAARLRPRIAPPPPSWFFVCFFCQDWLRGKIKSPKVRTGSGLIAGRFHVEEISLEVLLPRGPYNVCEDLVRAVKLIRCC